MEELKMHALQKLLINAEIETRSYSGRGMFGQECVGVDMDIGEFMQIYTIAIREQGSDLTDDEWDEIEVAVERLKADAMGKGTIIYFPNVPYTDVEPDED